MSIRVIRSINDFARHRTDVDVLCYCGHRNTLPYLAVTARFVAQNWPRDLGSALGRFRCSRCGSAARHIGPIPR